MVSKKRSIEIELLVDDKQKSKITGLGKEADNVGGKFTTMGKSIVGALGVFSAGQVVNAAFDMAMLADKANQAAISAEKVLGPALEGLRGKLDETRGVMGLNSGELDELIAKFGLLTEGFGLTDQAQAEFIEMMITTGGELAAFRGSVEDTPQAIDALGAAIRGEFDPLEQFGVKLKQSEVNERALQLQADDTTGALSDQEAQIAAIESLIREKAAPAFGSLARAQDTLGGKTNEAVTAWEDMKIEFGQEFLPIAADVLESLINIKNILTDVKSESENAGTSVEGFGEILQRVGETSLGEFRDLTEAAIGFLQAVGRIDDWFNQARNKPTPPRGQGLARGFLLPSSGGGSGGGALFRHEGGTVPGTPGSDVPIIAQAGEEVTRRSEVGSRRGVHSTVNIYNSNLSPVQVRALLELARRDRG